LLVNTQIAVWKHWPPSLLPKHSAKKILHKYVKLHSYESEGNGY
jgi:hypothetical protein